MKSFTVGRRQIEYIATGNSHDALAADLDAMVDDLKQLATDPQLLEALYGEYGF